MERGPLGTWLVLGKGDHGKDTFAEYLSDISGLKFTSSSLEALDVIWPCLKVVLGYTDEQKELAFAERRQNRLLWKELITLYNTPDKSALCKKILSKNDMYVGMRCNEEFEASKHLFDHIVYVDAGVRVEEEDPSMKIEFDPSCMILVNNNHGKDLLHKQASRILSAQFR